MVVRQQEAVDVAEAALNLEQAGVIQRDSPVPYYFQLCTYIEARIQSKDVLPGQLLPSEQVFCDLLGISRTVVRQAMAELSRKGLVTKQNGKRSVVSLRKHETGLLQTMEGFHEDAVARGQKPSTQVLQFKVVGADAEVAQALAIDQGEPVILLRRLRFLDGVPQVLVVSYLPEKLCPELLLEDLSDRSLYKILARRFGLVVSRGYRTIEAIALKSADARLLRVRAGAPALLLKSIGLLENGTPLEYFIAKHRGDRSKFEVRLVSAEADQRSGVSRKAHAQPSAVGLD
jgi:GntR family transcriptional regulator